MTCLACEILKLKRSNAILAVPREVPNPRLAEAIAKGKQTRGKRTAYTLSSNSVILSEHSYGWSIPKTIPNPKLDEQVRAAMDMPETCDLCAQLRDAQRTNAMLRVQALAEETVKQAKEYKRRAKAAGIDLTQLPKAVQTVSVILPLGEEVKKRRGSAWMLQKA